MNGSQNGKRVYVVFQTSTSASGSALPTSKSGCQFVIRPTVKSAYQVADTARTWNYAASRPRELVVSQDATGRECLVTAGGIRIMVGRKS